MGGLTSFEIIELIRKMRFNRLVGFDVVEATPPYNVSDLVITLAISIIYKEW